MVFILLFWWPSLLEKERAKMREIVDKHFPDNWVLPLYQGYLIDITEYWHKFPAAAKALENNMYTENI
jgi:WASH complex subunit strumpellin